MSFQPKAEKDAEISILILFAYKIKAKLIKLQGYDDDGKTDGIIEFNGEEYNVKVAEGQITIYNQEHPEGTTLDETYLPKDLATTGEQNVVLDANHYFVLGDNRPNSYDSRRFGPIDRSTIVGRAWLRGWPFNRVQTFTAPSYTNF